MIQPKYSKVNQPIALYDDVLYCQNKKQLKFGLGFKAILDIELPCSSDVIHKISAYGNNDHLVSSCSPLLVMGDPNKGNILMGQGGNVAFWTEQDNLKSFGDIYYLNFDGGIINMSPFPSMSKINFMKDSYNCNDMQVNNSTITITKTGTYNITSNIVYTDTKSTCYFAVHVNNVLEQSLLTLSRTNDETNVNNVYISGIMYLEENSTLDLRIGAEPSDKLQIILAKLIVSQI